MFSFERSADLLLVLIIGGTGYLYGGLIGAVIFKLMQDWIANLTPQYWQFWIGLVLVIIVLVGRDRIGAFTGGVRAFVEQFVRRLIPDRSPAAGLPQEGPDVPVALETQGLEKHFGGIAAVNDVSLVVQKGARHALIGPNGAGKTTVINLLTGVLRPSAGRILLEGQDITSLEASKRVRLGLARTFQINQLFLDLTPHRNHRPGDFGAHGHRRAVVAAGRHQPSSDRGDRRDTRSASTSPT